ncbi:unnamed protein product [Notodromas monacha]|uniref:Uncharacterized protein n=1 Tax=Notodromas monacha TaxID=399045 RepID=A0A7R9BX01_9CRUS|nr:unnamed protein product [Notodromas monacha]CAG0923337.1 unnamed protein product [Notodromas monacha]
MEEGGNGGILESQVRGGMFPGAGLDLRRSATGRSIHSCASAGRQAPVGPTASQGSSWPHQSPAHRTAVRLERISMILVTQLFGCPNNWVTGPRFGGLGIGKAKNCPGWQLD